MTTTKVSVLLSPNVSLPGFSLESQILLVITQAVLNLHISRAKRR
jgi:hypothetical protein